MTGKSGNSRDADVPLEATDDILAEDVAAAEAETKAEDKEAAEAKAGKSKKNAEGVTEKHKAKAPKINFKWSNVDPIIKVSFVVFMLACVIVLGSTVYDKTLADHTSAAAEYGDKVIVDYVGSYYVYYEEDGAVIFDTTLKSVGDNNADYVKSWEYSKTSYSTISLTIGNGKYLSMFENAIIGHHTGDKITVKIPAADAYGLVSDSQKGTCSLSAGEASIVKEYTSAQFKEFFGKDAPSAGTVNQKMTSPYGWDAFVSVDTDGKVVVNYSNVIAGDTLYNVNKNLDLKVTSVADGIISYEYKFKDTKADGTDKIELVKAIVDDSFVYVYSLGDDSFSYKTTEEKIGMDLYFTITFVGFDTSTSS